MLEKIMMQQFYLIFMITCKAQVEIDRFSCEMQVSRAFFYE